MKGIKVFVCTINVGKNRGKILGSVAANII